MTEMVPRGGAAGVGVGPELPTRATVAVQVDQSGQQGAAGRPPVRFGSGALRPGRSRGPTQEIRSSTTTTTPSSTTPAGVTTRPVSSIGVPLTPPMMSDRRATAGTDVARVEDRTVRTGR